MLRAEAIVDLEAIAANLTTVTRATPHSQVMAVVKADAYGHGLIPVSRTARDAGAAWLGVALLSEALTLRAAGDRQPILAWLWAPGDADLTAAVAAYVEISVSSQWALDEVLAIGSSAGRRPRVHLKVDTGMSRNGCTLHEWEALVTAASAAQRAGAVEILAVWSHLANADAPKGDPLYVTVDEQRQVLQQAMDVAHAQGLVDLRWHLANSAAALEHPSCHGHIVRVGIAMYGVSPMEERSAGDLGLQPAMTLRARIALVKQIQAGVAVSYGSTWIASEATTLALIPVGYADGIPRSASGRAWVSLDDAGGRQVPVVGRIAMDQLVVAVPADLLPRAGQVVTIFGDPRHGAPTVADWAAASGSIGYEIVTRIGPRVPRIYQGEEVRR